jgi:hypothetical protein
MAQNYDRIFENDGESSDRMKTLVYMSQDIRVKTPRNWLLAHVSPKIWGDAVIIHGISFLWNLKISVLQSSLSLLNYRHNESIAQADLVLIHVSGSHYLGTGNLSNWRDVYLPGGNEILLF